MRVSVYPPAVRAAQEHPLLVAGPPPRLVSLLHSCIDVLLIEPGSVLVNSVIVNLKSVVKAALFLDLARPSSSSTHSCKPAEVPFSPSLQARTFFASALR